VQIRSNYWRKKEQRQIVVREKFSRLLDNDAVMLKHTGPGHFLADRFDATGVCHHFLLFVPILSLVHILFPRPNREHTTNRVLYSCSSPLFQVYESWTIAAFLMLLIQYVGENPQAQKAVLAKKEKVRFFFPHQIPPLLRCLLIPSFYKKTKLPFPVSKCHLPDEVNAN
jgi:hypothetical protein